jgi:hypothetical protein
MMQAVIFLYFPVTVHGEYLLIRHFAQGNSDKHITLVPPYLDHCFVSGFPIADFFLEFSYILDRNVTKPKDYVSFLQQPA